MVDCLLMPLRILSSLVSPPGKRAKLSILIYHRVLPEYDWLNRSEAYATLFNRQMAVLAKNFNVLPLSEAISALPKGALPARAVSITFDDGYADNAEIALPILQRWGLSATFFISTGYLDGGCMWNDVVKEALRIAPGPTLDMTDIGLDQYIISTEDQRRTAIKQLLSAFKYLPQKERDTRVKDLADKVGAKFPANLMMCPDQVRLLSQAGMEIGGHTVTHPILSRLDRPSARAEIAEGKEYLESLTGVPVHLFAYPNGQPGQDYDTDSIRMIKELGFDAAVSTAWGVARADSDPFQLPRFTPWDKNDRKFIFRMLQNCLRGKAQVV